MLRCITDAFEKILILEEHFNALIFEFLIVCNIIIIIMHKEKDVGRCFNDSLLHSFNCLFIFQLPKVKTQLDKMSEVMKTDLSAIVQRVSRGHNSRDSLMSSDISVYMSVFFLLLLFSIHRDIPLWTTRHTWWLNRPEVLWTVSPAPLQTQMTLLWSCIMPYNVCCCWSVNIQVQVGVKNLLNIKFIQKKIDVCRQHSTL